MRDNVFLDTNIFIYALTKPKCKNDIPKRQTAIKLLQKLINGSNIDTLYSVDMQDGLILDGGFRIVNSF